MGLWLVGCSAYKAPCKSLAHPWIRVSYDSNVVDSTQLPFCLTCIDCACCSHITVLSLQPASTECKHSGVASYVARLPTISFLVHFGVNLTANYPSIV